MLRPGCRRCCLARFCRRLPVRRLLLLLLLLWLFFAGSFLSFSFFYPGHFSGGKCSPSERGIVGHGESQANASGSRNSTPASPPAATGLNRTFSYQEDIVSPLRIPYQILAGRSPASKKYMSIGISSVRRRKENYLLGTLQSVFSQSRESDIEDMVLVVFLADWDPEVQGQVVREVSDGFGKQLAAGHLLLVASPRAAYPTLEGLKRNYDDSEERVRYRSKQNVDYAFLSNFCADLSSYHLVLEDDVSCSRDFLRSIRRKVEAYPGPWTTMAFSKLGYIGKLYHSADLPALARFLLLFYDEMPCDWLLDLFFNSNAQKRPIRMSPSLFQHVGSFSSFQGGANSLRDDDFRDDPRGLGDNPPAALDTDMEAFRENTLRAVYQGVGFFWGKGVANGSHVSVRFEEPASLGRVRIRTGSPEHSGDILRRGLAEVGWRGREGEDLGACQTYRGIGRFVNGTLDVEGLGLGPGGAVDCLRVRVTGDQKEWLILSELSVWLESTGKAIGKEPVK